LSRELTRNLSAREFPIARHACALTRFRRERLHSGATSLEAFVDFRDWRKSRRDEAESYLAALDEGEVVRFSKEPATRGCARQFPGSFAEVEIEGDGKPIAKIKQLVGAVFSRLFVPTISFKPVENVRDEARALLAKTEANKLIKLCQSESAPRVSFETTERSTVTA
jgi:hypothetical protein